MSDEVITLVREMVAIPSISPGFEETFDRPYGEGEMADFVGDFCRRAGFDVEKREVRPGRFNVLARIEGRRPDVVVFCSHLDTVDVQNMTVAPFDPVIKDGKIWGRGSCDDKGSLAAMMVALKGVASAGKPPVTFVLAGTCAEEHGQYGAWDVFEHVGGVRAAVIGEPTELNIVRAHKGAARWSMTTTGTRAHGATPELGVNAVYRMARVAMAIEEYHDRLKSGLAHADLGPATISVGTIEGGEEVNSVPDRCTIQVDRRLLPGELPKQARADMHEFFSSHERIDFDVEIGVLGEHNPMECGRDDPVVQLALSCARTRKPAAELAVASYGTDAASLSAWGCPTPVMGPGDIAHAHTAAEHIDIEELQAAVEVYRTFADRVADVLE